MGQYALYSVILLAILEKQINVFDADRYSNFPCEDIRGKKPAATFCPSARFLPPVVLPPGAYLHPSPQTPRQHGTSNHMEKVGCTQDKLSLTFLPGTYLTYLNITSHLPKTDSTQHSAFLPLVILPPSPPSMEKLDVTQVKLSLTLSLPSYGNPKV